MTHHKSRRMGLALNVGFASLALGIERVEVLFEAVLGGFSGIDGALRHLAFL
jgi:hypothetical protein